MTFPWRVTFYYSEKACKLLLCKYLYILGRLIINIDFPWKKEKAVVDDGFPKDFQLTQAPHLLSESYPIIEVRCRPTLKILRRRITGPG